jgi:hypothetical protein
MSIQDERVLNQGYPEAGAGDPPMTYDDIQAQYNSELRRLIWNAKKLSEKLESERTRQCLEYDIRTKYGQSPKYPPHPPLYRSEDAWTIRELLNYISKHDVENFRDIELKIKKED